jgi:hypothetical protein
VSPVRPIEDLTLEIGGPCSLSAVVLDERNREPIAGASVSLRPSPNLPLHFRGVTDGDGRAAIEGIPPASYELTVDARDRQLFTESFEGRGGRVERTILLEPAAWIVVHFEPAPSRRAEHRLLVVALQGGDPGWPFRFRTDLAPATSAVLGADPVRLRTRPASYRMRFEVKENSSIRSPALVIRELDVVVPVGGQATVNLP